MKKFLIPFVCAIFCYFPQSISAQAIPADSVISIALSHINKDLVQYHHNPKKIEDYNISFYIEDLATGQPYAGEKNGIYEFALYNDDGPRWLMWLDATGYKVYYQKFDIQLLGEILEFCKRNKYPAEKSLKYIEGIYNLYYILDVEYLHEITP